MRPLSGFFLTAIAACLVVAAGADAQSLFQRSSNAPRSGAGAEALYDVSMFAIKRPEPRVFAANDLITIIIREKNKVERSSEIDTSKEYSNKLLLLNSKLLKQFLQLRLPVKAATSTRGHTLAKSENEFTGTGDYTREDRLDARVTARILEVKPNGTLLLEAHTATKTDDEVQDITLSGLCRSDDVTNDNTVLSTQLFDLNLNIQHQGELRKVNKKGLLTRILETIFNF